LKTAFLIYAVSLVVLSWAQTASLESEMLHDSAHYLELARSVQRGDGYLTQTHWAINLPRTDLPYPDTYRAPLFPIAVAGVTFLTGDLFTSAKWICVVTGAMIPVLVFLFARRRFGLPVWLAVLGAAATLVNHHLLISGTRPLTETPFTAGVLGVLYVVTGRSPAVVWVGLLTGVAWLIRYQAALLIPVCLLALTGPTVRVRDWLRRSLLLVIAALVVTSPWLVRNYQLTGSPFYSDLKYHAVSTYDPDRSMYAYFHGLAPAQTWPSYVIDHPQHVAEHVLTGVWRLSKDFPRENAGNVFLFTFAAAGWIVLLRRRRETAQRRVNLLFTTYGLLTAALVVSTFVDHRHLTSLDPFVGLFAAVAVASAWSTFASTRRWLSRGLLTLLLIGIVYEGYSSFHRLNANDYHPMADFLAAEPYLREHLSPGEAVMDPKPYFASYRLDHPAVSLPWVDDNGFRSLADRYNVRLAVVPDAIARDKAFPGSFLETGVTPDWIREVQRIDDPPLRIYEMVEGR
jgi:hypothetical protein